MEAVLNTAAIYVVLLVLLRLAGKRTLSESTPFDLVLLLIISEATQQALLGDDFSMTKGLIVITTLIGLDIAISLVKNRSELAERLIEGRSLLLIDDGELLEERLRKARVDPDDILSAARAAHGLGSLDEIRFAVLERSGGISVIPWRS